MSKSKKKSPFDRANFNPKIQDLNDLLADLEGGPDVVPAWLRDAEPPTGKSVVGFTPIESIDHGYYG